METARIWTEKLPRFRRHECKYLIPESAAGELRRFIAPYTEPDPHANEQFHGSYRVLSLYLDTPKLRLYRETREGLAERIKLRIRSYGKRDSAPVFLEVKRRRNRLVLKSRARIGRGQMRELLAGGAPDVGKLEGSCYDEFLCWIARYGARPVVHVGYEREAHVGCFDRGLRVTLDRELRCASADEGWRLESAELDWVEPLTDRVILELKFDHAFPSWMRDLTRQLKLQRVSFSKYGHSVRSAFDPLIRSMA
ncbi:MAG: VTC domain-containing protein [Planctomycetota bacterium]